MVEGYLLTWIFYKKDQHKFKETKKQQFAKLKNVGASFKHVIKCKNPRVLT